MILAIPIIYLIKGKSKYSITGLPEFSKLNSYFKDYPFNLAKLFREENNKSILFHSDMSKESLDIIKSVKSKLDIPIQALFLKDLSEEEVNLINELSVNRLFLPFEQCIKIKTAIPIINISDINSKNIINYERVMIECGNEAIEKINLNIENKVSIINSYTTTQSLSKLNKYPSNIDSVYLGKEYYGTHFAGQKLWRIAEKTQFLI